VTAAKPFVMCTRFARIGDERKKLGSFGCGVVGESSRFYFSKI